MKLAERMGRLGTESAFEVLARARACEARGQNVVHLEIGEPDFATPANIVAAAERALREGHTHYGPAPGLSVLREAIAQRLWRTHHLTVDPQQVVVTPGAKPVIFYSLLALVERGDEIIYPNPGFPIYESMIRFCGGTPVPLPLLEERGFAFDPAQLESLITPRTRMIILNSPGNPTGGVLNHVALAEISRVAVAHDLVVLADEIYSELLYEGQYESILTFPGMAERTILLDGFSKTYAMTGWRLGYGVFPRGLVEPVTRIIINSVSCTNAATQMAGVEALTGPQDAVAAMRAEFRRRRDFLIHGLNQIPGIHCVMPEGAFYAFPNISALGVDTQSFANSLLEDHGVATLAGSSFGRYGDGYLRLSYATSQAMLQLALERISAAVQQLPGRQPA